MQFLSPCLAPGLRTPGPCAAVQHHSCAGTDLDVSLAPDMAEITGHLLQRTLCITVSLLPPSWDVVCPTVAGTGQWEWHTQRPVLVCHYPICTMVLTVVTVKGLLGAQVDLVFLQFTALHSIFTLARTVLLNILTLGQVMLQFTQWPLPLTAILHLTASHLQFINHIEFKVFVVYC